MSKLTIVANILAKEGKSDLVKAELTKLIVPTRAENGCINYDLHQDNTNQNLFLFFENWTNREVWLAHMETAHIKEYMKAVDGAIEDFTVLEMTEVG